MNLLKT
jgi:hypothetical protein